MAKNEVRIIGGKWRGRKLKFPDVPGLRPSQDRARETLFNWLAPWIEGARVLDLFAGSGVLGFEAISRGAATAELVDISKATVVALEHSKGLLDASNAAVFRSDGIKHLQNREAPYDLIFVDPPFNKNLAKPALKAIIEQQLLTQDGLIYLEQARRSDLASDLPSGFSIYRDKAFGDSRALLLEPE